MGKKRESWKEIKQHLAKRGIHYLTVPKTSDLNKAIQLRLKKYGFEIGAKGIKKLQKAIPELKKHGIGRLTLYAEPWRKSKFLKVETTPKGATQWSYVWNIPVKKRKR